METIDYLRAYLVHLTRMMTLCKVGIRADAMKFGQQVFPSLENLLAEVSGELTEAIREEMAQFKRLLLQGDDNVDPEEMTFCLEKLKTRTPGELMAAVREEVAQFKDLLYKERFVMPEAMLCCIESMATILLLMKV